MPSRYVEELHTPTTVKNFERRKIMNKSANDKIFLKLFLILIEMNGY